MIAAPLTNKPYADNDAQHSKLIAYKRRGGFGVSETGDIAGTLESEGGTHQGGPERTPMIAFDRTRGTSSGDITGPLRKCGAASKGVNDAKADTQCVAWHENQGGDLTPDPDQIAKALKAGAPHSYQGVGSSFGVRRLTPTECERLQGFPDGHTAGQSDSARYRQLGNAVEADCAEWIGYRLLEVLNATT